MLRLLSIEDDLLMAQLICGIAQEAGFETRICNGKASIATYDEFAPDIVVLDILMPEIDGFEVLQYLKNRQSKSRIIILSGSDSAFRRMAHSLADGLKLSLEAAVIKPFHHASLLETFSRLHEALLQERCSGASIYAAPEDSLPRINSN